MKRPPRLPKDAIICASAFNACPRISNAWGLTPLDTQSRHDLLEILEDRYGRKSTLITSQLPVADWHTLIGNATYADAILDRLVHNAHRISLKGESIRRLKSNSPLT